MKRPAFLAVACLLMAAMRVLFAATPDPKALADVLQPLVITEKDEGKTVNARVGQAIEVRLEGAESRTGWEASAVEKAILRKGFQKGERSVPAECTFTPVPNAPHAEAGTYAFAYTAVAPGKVQLRFVYLFPGGPVPAPRKATKLVKEFKVIVEVTK